MPDFPSWLHGLAVSSLLIGGLCTLIVAVDIARHPQKMWIMDIVWPVTALFGSALWLAAYWQWGRNVEKSEDAKPPFWVAVGKGASHCGAGCTLGDLVAEWLAFAFPVIAVWFGWHSLFAEKTFAVWIPDFILAFGLGIVFQYFTIKPMRDLSVGGGIKAAVKADIASISSWQIGMYGMMALIQFGWWKHDYGGVAEVATPEFWFAMQIAMLAGFATAYPVNWWLIRTRWKEQM